MLPQGELEGEGLRNPPAVQPNANLLIYRLFFIVVKKINFIALKN
jgi:hypothetical protein